MRIIRRIVEKLFGLEPDVCMNCETLRGLLEAERIERNTLTQALIETTKPPKLEITTPTVGEELKPINPSSFTPWRVRRNMLEQEDRQRAKILRQHTEELEKAVGLDLKPEKEHILEKYSEDAPRAEAEKN